ncbi:MAG: methionyl-tRNA formyltransferase [Abditibacteriota bacterium]|nr:methionyl-tRNA formyltransferase [Abditibacteriota bacterium]
MRIIFMGTPALAVPHLEACLDEHEVLCVVTQPDKMARRGRQMEAAPSPVKARALELGLPVLQPEKARDPLFVEQLRELKPEALAVVAYGQILPQSMLDLPRENHAGGGCINVHFSLLPRWRGAAPVQYAIWHGDVETGVTTQWMAARLDAGDVILQENVPIEANETSGELLQRLTPIGARMLSRTLQLMSENRAPRTPQDESNVTLCPQIERDMGRINWQQPAQQIHNLVRAFHPWPNAWCQWRGEALKVLSTRVVHGGGSAAPGTIKIEENRVLVVTGAGHLELHEIQPAGKPRLAPLDWARGARLESGDRFE